MYNNIIIMESSANSAKQSGNTKQIAASKRWCFTFNNWEEKEYIETIDKFKAISANYIVGKETGESGTPHLQGYIELEKRFRPSELKLSKKIHWEKCKGSPEENIKYCSKDGDFSTNFKVGLPVKTLKESQLYEWQKDIIKIISEPVDDRKIYWFWEEKGCKGKTTFAKYLSIKYQAIPLEGKKNDILFCAATYDAPIYIFDCERTMENYISYAALEKIKNGYYMCSKYESKPIIRNCPHLIVFANFAPDVEALSADRWVIKNIT